MKYMYFGFGINSKIKLEYQHSLLQEESLFFGKDKITTVYQNINITIYIYTIKFN